MNYDHLIETVSLIVENPKIVKEGLTLVYELESKNHRKMNEHLFYMSNSNGTPFVPSEEFEVEIGGIVVKFIKIKPKEDLEQSE
jgi:hypothetical protein